MPLSIYSILQADFMDSFMLNLKVIRYGENLLSRQCCYYTCLLS
jgi:hypothetical protein